MKTFLIILIIFSLCSGLVLSATEQEALDSIESVELKIVQMSVDNLNTALFEDKLVDAKSVFDRVKAAELISLNLSGEPAETVKKAISGIDLDELSYDRVIIKTKKILEEIEFAYSVYDGLKKTESELETPDNSVSVSNGITGLLIYPIQSNIPLNFSEEKNKIEEAKSAFESGRYEESLVIIEQANDMINKKRSGAALQELVKTAGKSFFEKNLSALIVLCILFSVSSAVIYKQYRIKKAKTKLRKLHAEKKALVGSIKNTQVQRFRHGNLPDSVYKIRMSIYHQKLNEVKKEIPSIKEMLKKGRV